MKWVVMGFVLIGGAVLQTFIPASLLLGQAKVPFLLSVTLYYALCHDTDHMLAAAFFAGFMQDVMSPIPLGYSSFCFCILGLIASRFRTIMMAESLLPPAFFGCVAGVVAVLGLYILLAREELVSCSFWWLLLKMIGGGILCGLSTPIVFLVVGKLDSMVGNVAVKEETVVLDIE